MNYHVSTLIVCDRQYVQFLRIPISAIKARNRSQQWITTPPLPAAPSMPTLTETSPIQFKKVEKKNPAPIPVKEEKPAPLPVKELKPANGIDKPSVSNDPPPSYSKEITNKKSSPPPIDKKVEVKQEIIPNLTLATNPITVTTVKPPEEVIDQPIKIELPTIANKNTPKLKDQLNESAMFRSKISEDQRSPLAIPRPITLPTSFPETKMSEDMVDAPPPLPTSAPPIEDPLPWFEVEEELIDPTATPIKPAERKTTTTGKKKAPTAPAPLRISQPTDALPILSTPEPRPTPPSSIHINNPLNGNHSLASPKVIKIGVTTPPPVQKPSRIRALFGLSSPTSSPEPPKPKARRIRVPKQKSPKDSPKPMPRTISFEKTKPKSPTDTPKEEKKEMAKEENNYSYDTPLTILPKKLPDSSVISPKAPARKGKQGPVTSQGKQLSFAQNAIMYSDDDMTSLKSNEPEDDSWDLVAKHRANITANATQVKAAAAAKHSRAAGTEKRVDFVPIDRPRTMREMRKSQSVGAGVNLKNKNNLVDQSDTEA